MNDDDRKIKKNIFLNDDDNKFVDESIARLMKKPKVGNLEESAGLGVITESVDRGGVLFFIYRTIGYITIKKRRK